MQCCQYRLSAECKALTVKPASLAILGGKGFIYQQEGIQLFYNAAASLPLMALPTSYPRCLQKGQEECEIMRRGLTAWNPLV